MHPHFRHAAPAIAAAAAVRRRRQPDHRRFDVNVAVLYAEDSVDETLVGQLGAERRHEVGGAVDVVVSGAASVPAQSGTSAFSTSHALTVVSFQGGSRQVLWTVGPGSVQ